MTEQPRFRPFVPENMEMKELTLRAVLLGLVLCVVLGAANAYLGLRAGITIAATYPAAVMAVFTLWAFVVSKAWPSLGFADAYWQSTALMTVGGILGFLFVSLVRR